MRLLLIRHAETDGNGERYIGREDPPLNARGRAQAEALAESLRDERIDRVLSSPLRRAIETAEAVARPRDLAIERRDGLMELDFGALQGRLKAEVSLSIRRSHDETPLPGGESLADLRRRLAEIHAEIADRAHRGETVAIVGHYWSCRVLDGLIRGDRGQRYRPRNASVLVIDVGAGSPLPQ